MTRIQYNAETMKLTTLFETITGSNLKDCFKDDEGLVFVVQPGEAAKAIGKKGVNVRKLNQSFKKNIKIFEYDPNLENFIKNILSNIKNISVKLNGKTAEIECPDKKTKGMVYGRERENLEKLKNIVKRYFEVEDIVVKP